MEEAGESEFNKQTGLIIPVIECVSVCSFSPEPLCPDSSGATVSVSVRDEVLWRSGTEVFTG